jgi:gamma-glutamyltranspeptidase/glutathione hydrolase
MAGASAAVPGSLEPPPNRQGEKEVVHGRKAVASSQSPIVTEVMLQVLREGGNAVDATVAGNIVQATVQPEMTNHTGTVSWIYWNARERKSYQLNSSGTLHPGLPPFRTWPDGVGGVASGSPMACIPGFMPGLQVMHERFGTKPWKSLVEPAIPWAEDGFPVDEFQRAVMEYELEGST